MDQGQQHWWQSVLDTLEEGVEIVDATGRITYLNPAFSRISGLQPAQRLGRMIDDVAPTLDLAEVLRTGKPIMRREATLEGSVEVVVNCLPLPGKDGRPGGAVLVLQDVTRLLRLSRELQQHSTMLENLYSRMEDITRAHYTFADLTGSSPALGETIAAARLAARSDSTVLLTGESGTGKELFAHAIHNASRRRNGPFITVNCAAVPEHLLESEFFGYEKGAFTGATRRKLGMFELAQDGTILLDEIGEMNLALQSRLLRVLQDYTFYRLGGTNPVHLNVRVIAATNINLQEQVAAGRFRRDLYYRLNVVHIHLPPLRQRLSDLPELTETMVARLARRLNRTVAGVRPEAMAAMRQYHWPGNVRELENLLERAINLLPQDELWIGDAALRFLQVAQTGSSGTQEITLGEGITLKEAERQLISRALARHGMSGAGKRAAARELGISLTTLYERVRQYGLEKAP